jgi:hypothetical protein
MNDAITLTNIEELKDPRNLFNIVMLYADATNKNPWECMAYVFNPAKHTVIMWAKEKIIGYINTEIVYDNELFINHAFVKYPVENKPKLLDDMIKKIGEKLNYNFTYAIMHSDKPKRLWTQWGFTETDMIVYRREVE